jgi:hypothetical protein
MIGKGIAFKTKYRIASFLVMVLAGSLLGFAPSSAATTTTTACVTTKTGAIRILLKGTCKAKIEKKISWKSNGVRGIQGVQGIQGIQGIQGAQGLTGAQGATGAAGVNGNTIWYGTVAPAANIGVAGDFYVNTVTNFWFGPKTTVWPAGISLVGPAGAAGINGSTGATGPAGPTGATGATGATVTSLTSIWLTPNDLKSGYTGASVQSLAVNGYMADLLKAPEAWGFSTVALPKDWESASSFTYKVFWIVTDDYTPATGDMNSFVLGAKGWSQGQAISAPSCGSGTCSIVSTAPTKNQLQLSTVTIQNTGANAVTQNQLLQIWFGRNSISTLDVDLYVYGLQVTANS